MGRRAKPWPNRTTGWYCVTIEGRRIRLCRIEDGEAKAYKEFHRLMAAPKVIPSRPGPRARDLADVFADHIARELSAASYVWYMGQLNLFVEHVGEETPAADLGPRHVGEFLDTRRWNPTSRRNAVTAIKRLFRWSRKQGYIAVDPMGDVEKPRALVREKILTHAQVNEILDVTRDQEFRDIVTALRETGCRPGEVMSLTAAAVDLKAGTWRVANKTRHATGEDHRTIYLNPAMVAMSTRLTGEHPEGPIFRNSLGKPWVRDSIGNRFRARRAKLGYGMESVAYSLRHLYITDALERGVPPATVAELVGHRSLTMIMKIYNKLRHRTDHLREAARTIRPETSS